MDNVSTLKLSLVKINSVLICSIWVSIKSFTLQQTDLIAQSYTSVFHLDFWFPDSPKTCYRHCIILTSKLFFVVTTGPKSSIKFPKEQFQRVAQPWKKDHYLGCATNENDLSCSESWTFGLTSKFKPVFLHKVRTDFFKKDHNQKIFLCKVEFDWKTKNFNRYTRNTTL